MWALMVVTTIGIAFVTSLKPRMHPLFLWITWTAVGMSLLKSFVPLVSSKPVLMETLFLVQGLLISLWAARLAAGNHGGETEPGRSILS